MKKLFKDETVLRSRAWMTRGRCGLPHKRDSTSN